MEETASTGDITNAINLGQGNKQKIKILSKCDSSLFTDNFFLVMINGKTSYNFNHILSNLQRRLVGIKV